MGGGSLTGRSKRTKNEKEKKKTDADKGLRQKTSVFHFFVNREGRGEKDRKGFPNEKRFEKRSDPSLT